MIGALFFVEAPLFHGDLIGILAVGHAQMVFRRQQRRYQIASDRGSTPIPEELDGMQLLF